MTNIQKILIIHTINSSKDLLQQYIKSSKRQLKNKHVLKNIMSITMQKLTTFYILSTFTLFGYTFNQVYRKADNYFSASIIYLDDVITNFIFYNMIFSLGILFYKLCIWMFFQEVKENETLKMVDKLKAKIIDVILFCYILDGQIEINSFTCIVFIFFSYVIHCMSIFRADYLVHTPASLSLNLNYRLTALFLIILFCDFQMLNYSLDLLYSQNPTYFIFAYYTIIISLSTVQPVIRYFIDFYEKYTLSHVRNIDEKLALISLLISVPRLLIQICLAIVLAVKFSIFFYLIFTVIELISQLTHIIKSYNRIKKLTDTMRNLKKIGLQEIQKHHDNTCMVCFQDMTQATLLPCKHFFHDQCLRQWIIKNSNHFCPKCKKQFNFDNKTQQKVERNEQLQRIQNQRQINEKIRQQRTIRLQKMQQKMGKSKQKKKQAILKNDQKNREDVQIEQKPFKKQSYNKLIKEQEEPFSSQKIGQKDSSQLSGQDNSHKQKGENVPLSSSGLLQHTSFFSLDTPLQIVQQRRRQHLRMGSIAYGLPTEAVYRRSHKHIYVRDLYQRANQQLVRDFSLREYDQMMLFADN